MRGYNTILYLVNLKNERFYPFLEPESSRDNPTHFFQYAPEC